MRFKYFTLFIVDSENRDKDHSKMLFATKRVKKFAQKTKVLYPPQWATDDDGYVDGRFWPSQCGKLWLQKEMEKFAEELELENCNTYHEFYDSHHDYSV